MSISTSKKDPSVEAALYVTTTSAGPTETEVPVVAPVEQAESSGGAFSQQKGASSAIGLSAVLSAMAAYLEAVELKRARTQSSLEVQSKAAKLQSDNLNNIGQREMTGGWIIGALGIASGVFGAVTMGLSFKGGYALDKELGGLTNQKKYVDDHITALNQKIAANPAGVRMGRVLGGGDPTAANLSQGIVGPVPAGYKPGTLSPGVDDALDTIAASSNRDEALKKLQGNSDALSKKIDANVAGHTTMFNKANALTTLSNTLIAQALTGIVKSTWIDPYVKGQEALQIHNKLSGDYAAQSVHMETSSSEARERDLNTIMTLPREMTSADIVRG